MTLVKPTLSIQVGFTANVTAPLSTVTWTDITQYVLPWNTDTGRQHELQKFDPGTAGLLLNNNDRRFDPTNTSSPYYPNLLPLRRIRIRETWQGVTEHIFTGYVRGWPMTWEGATRGTMKIQCVDALGAVLNLPQLEGSPWQQVVRRDLPAATSAAWYRLGESSGRVAPDHSGNGHDGQYQGLDNPPQDTMGVPGLITGDDDRAFSPNQTTAPGARLSAPYKNLITGFPFSVEFWMRAKEDRSRYRMAFAAYDRPIAPTQEFYAGIQSNASSGAGCIAMNIVRGSQTWMFRRSTSIVDNGVVHHVVFAVTSSAITVYVDGVNVSTGSSPTIGPFPNDLTMGYAVGNTPAWEYGDRSFAAHLGDAIDEMIFYNGVALSAARVAAHYTAGSTAWAGETSGIRIGRVLDEATSWPAADRALDIGVSSMAPRLSGGGVTNYLQQVEQSEQGALFVNAAGQLEFHSRHKVLQAPYTTSQVTFGPNAVGGEIPYEKGLLWSVDDTDLINEQIGSRVDGAPQRAVDAASQTTYGRRQGQTMDSLLLLTDEEVRDLVHWRVQHYSTPVPRVRQIKVHLSALAANPDVTNAYGRVLALKLRQRVTVRATPPGGGPAFSQPSHIEKISHEVDEKGEWWTTLSLSAAEVQSFWVLGVSALGTGTRLAA